MNFVFFGTDDFSVITLEELEKKEMLPKSIITVPDRPQGRGLEMTKPLTKQWAEKRNIPVFQPENLKTLDATGLHLDNTDFFVVASYGKIIPQNILDLPKHGTLNIHPSLLPLLRGASPIETQILNDNNEIGVTIMLMDALMDHGPILEQLYVEPPYWPMRATDLRTLLAHAGGELLAETIPHWLDGEIEPQEQDHDEATFSHKIQKSDAQIFLDDDPYNNLLKIRAYDEWPRAFFFDENDKRVIVTEAEVVDGELCIRRVIPEGKKEMKYTK